MVDDKIGKLCLVNHDITWICKQQTINQIILHESEKKFWCNYTELGLFNYEFKDVWEALVHPESKLGK